MNSSGNKGRKEGKKRRKERKKNSSNERRTAQKNEKKIERKEGKTHPQVRRVLRFCSFFERCDKEVELKVLVHNRLRILVRDVVDRVFTLTNCAHKPAKHLEIPVRADPVAVHLVRERFTRVVPPAVV